GCLRAGMGGVVDGVFGPSLASLAVIVEEPGVRRLTTNVWEPPTSAASGGRTAEPSVEVIVTVSVAETGLKAPSTAWTVIVKGMFAACGEGLPLTPVGEPGAA